MHARRAPASITKACCIRCSVVEVGWLYRAGRLRGTVVRRRYTSPRPCTMHGGSTVIVGPPPGGSPTGQGYPDRVWAGTRLGSRDRRCGSAPRSVARRLDRWSRHRSAPRASDLCVRGIPSQKIAHISSLNTTDRWPAVWPGVGTKSTSPAWVTRWLLGKGPSGSGCMSTRVGRNQSGQRFGRKPRSIPSTPVAFSCSRRASRCSALGKCASPPAWSVCR